MILTPFTLEEKTMLAWISDGSPVSWSDTIKLDNVKTVDILGSILNQGYEGLLDYNVGIKELTIPWQEGGMDAEAEWVLVFDQSLHEIDNISEDTHCSLEGMIEGKWMKPMLGKGQIEWGPASIGNNVMTLEGKIDIKLGNLVSKKEPFPMYSIVVEFSTASGNLVTHTTSTIDLKKIPIVELVRAVKDKTPKDLDIRAINLGANGKNAAYVNHSRKQIASIFKSWPTLISNHSNIINNARAELFEELIEDMEYIPAGGKATLSIFDQLVTKSATTPVAKCSLILTQPS